MAEKPNIKGDKIELLTQALCPHCGSSDCYPNEYNMYCRICDESIPHEQMVYSRGYVERLIACIDFLKEAIDPLLTVTLGMDMLGDDVDMENIEILVSADELMKVYQAVISPPTSPTRSE